mgnify:CR=1 FL=1
MKKIAIFASGSGSNAENIYQYFKNSDKINISTLVCNNPQAGVIERFIDKDVEVLLIEKKDLANVEFIQDLKEIDLIVLAGFLVLIPIELIRAFPNKIINIHPSLLPKYGGKGMYGDHVHKAVIQNQELESGITIHYVNEEFDKGEIIFQAKCELNANDDLSSLKDKIHQLEMDNFPRIIAEILEKSIE